MRLSRLSTALSAAAVTSAVAATAAFAHTEVKSTYPAKGKSASTRISTVSVTFSATIRSGTIKVTGPGGRTYSSGSGGRDPPVRRNATATVKVSKAAAKALKALKKSVSVTVEATSGDRFATAKTKFTR